MLSAKGWMEPYANQVIAIPLPSSNAQAKAQQKKDTPSCASETSSTY